MGEHKHREGIKGDSYKAIQRIEPKPLRIKQAQTSDKWMIKHGWRKNEEGKWERS